MGPWNKNRLLHRKCAVRIFIHESQNFRNERVSVANEWVSKVLQRVNKIRTKQFLWCNLFVIYIRPISCNKPSKKNFVLFIFHTVKYKEYRILFGRFITWNWPYIYNKIYYCTQYLHQHNRCVSSNIESLLVYLVRLDRGDTLDCFIWNSAG